MIVNPADERRFNTADPCGRVKDNTYMQIDSEDITYISEKNLREKVSPV